MSKELLSYVPDPNSPGSRYHIVLLGESLFLNDSRLEETELTQWISNILNWIPNTRSHRTGAPQQISPLRMSA